MAFPSGRRQRRPTALWILVLLGLGGCAAAGPGGGGGSGELTGPTDPIRPTYGPWAYDGREGVVIHTPHYDIYTTATDPAVRRRLPAVMEGALDQYHRLAPGVPLDGPPMRCFVFGTREQWADYTRRTTGADAYWYLKINRGGYAVRQEYVAYNVGEAATLTVAAHEGWHQFASRHFVGRLPPFLEEGVATMFEDLRWTGSDADGLPRWNLRVNRSRAEALQRAARGGYVFPLAQLIRMNAGSVVAGAGPQIDAFYAQGWAFATFLWSADGGKYRPALRQLIDDVAAGVVFDPTGVHRDARLPWNPSGIRPMLEHYLGKPLEAIDVDYQRYVHKVAFEDYNQQWN